MTGPRVTDEQLDAGPDVGDMLDALLAGERIEICELVDDDDGMVSDVALKPDSWREAVTAAYQALQEAEKP